MVEFTLTHILMVLATAAIIALGCWGVSKLSHKWQTVVFIAVAVIGSGGIFFRYAMGLKFTFDFAWGTLAEQMLQVCNFNFIILPLMLIPKFELIRQYSLMFSMLAAFTTFVDMPSSWASLHWYDLSIINFWLNHSCAIALPLLMMASRRLKPQKKYIWRVLVAMFVYFSVVAGITYIMLRKGMVTVERTHSFVFYTGKNPLMEALKKIIPFDYFYIWPLGGVWALLMWPVTAIFSKYKVRPYSELKGTLSA